VTSQGPEPGSDDLSELLTAAGQGDASAWKTLLDRYGRRVFALARSRCRDSDMAEEITQSVFATIAAKVGQGEYAERGRFESWLFRVAMNRVRDYIRRQRRTPEQLGSVSAEPVAPTAAPGIADAGTMHQLRAALESLSDKDREVVELRHHGGLSFSQMADMLDEPLGTILARHHRALRKLKELLESGVEMTPEALL